VTRKQRPRGATTREDVVNAALVVADREGVEALTIRAIAEIVGAPPMSLYSHFANKEELLDLMYAAVAQRMYEDDGHPTWQVQLFALCRRVRRILKGHPNWAPLLSRPSPPLAVPLRERVLALMVADGLPEQEAFRALSSAVLVAMGLTLVEITLTGTDGKSAVQQRFERMKKWFDAQPKNDRSVSRTAISKVGEDVLDDVFESSIGALVRGFEVGRVSTPDGRGGRG
jgi:AcrR family transcriptional regulator